MRKICDPRLHLLVLGLAALFTLLAKTQAQLHLLVLCSLLYLGANGRWLQALKMGAFYAFGLWLLAVLPTRVGSISLFLFLMLRTLPVLCVGSLLAASPPGAIMLAGRRMGLPRLGLVMVCVLLRFAPVIRQEMAAISQGIRARGLLPHWYSVILHPVRSYECFVLPLIIRGLRLTSELTCAAQFRGMESDTARSSIYETHPLHAHAALLAGYGAMGLVCVMRLGSML